MAAALLLTCMWVAFHATMVAADPCGDRAATGVCPASVLPEAPPGLLASPVAGPHRPQMPVCAVVAGELERPRASPTGAATPRSPPPLAA